MNYLISKIIERLENFEQHNQGKVVFTTEKKGVKIANETQKQHKERKREGSDNCC